MLDVQAAAKSIPYVVGLSVAVDGPCLLHLVEFGPCGVSFTPFRHRLCRAYLQARQTNKQITIYSVARSKQ